MRTTKQNVQCRLNALNDALGTDFILNKEYKGYSITNKKGTGYIFSQDMYHNLTTWYYVLNACLRAIQIDRVGTGGASYYPDDKAKYLANKN